MDRMELIVLTLLSWSFWCFYRNYVIIKLIRNIDPT